MADKCDKNGMKMNDTYTWKTGVWWERLRLKEWECG